MGIVYLLGKKKKRTISQEPEIPVIPEVPEYTGKIYGVRIDNTTSPDGAVTYTDDAVGFTPASSNNGNFDYGSWRNEFPFNKIRPCMLSKDTVIAYLNPDNFYRDVDDNSVNIDYFGGNVMIEFPKVYYKFGKATDGTYVYMQYSDTKHDDTWKCYAHTVGQEERDKLYLGAFLGGSSSSSSLSNSTVNTSASIDSMRTSAKLHKGLDGQDRYSLMGWNQLVLIQLLFLIMFKSRNYLALGEGASTTRTTGSTVRKGMFYGSTTTSEKVKFCGLEDIWGNYDQFIDGVKVGSSAENYGLLIGYDHTKFADETTYKLYGGYGVQSNGILTSILSTTEGGFAPRFTNSSALSGTYYVNKAQMTAGRYLLYGGYATGTSTYGRGIFKMHFTSTTTGTSSRTARLMYL